MTALLKTTKGWKQCKCPSMQDSRDKLWQTHHNGILLNHKNEEVLTHATTRIKTPGQRS